MEAERRGWHIGSCSPPSCQARPKQDGSKNIYKFVITLFYLCFSSLSVYNFWAFHRNEADMKKFTHMRQPLINYVVQFLWVESCIYFFYIWHTYLGGNSAFGNKLTVATFHTGPKTITSFLSFGLAPSTQCKHIKDIDDIDMVWGQSPWRSDHWVVLEVGFRAKCVIVFVLVLISFCVA